MDGPPPQERPLSKVGVHAVPPAGQGSVTALFAPVPASEVVFDGRHDGEPGAEGHDMLGLVGSGSKAEDFVG